MRAWLIAYDGKDRARQFAEEFDMPLWAARVVIWVLR